MGVASNLSATRALRRQRRIMARQDEVRWGPDYRSADEMGWSDGNLGGDGGLPAPQLGRSVYAASMPEKKAAAFYLYANSFELHDHFVYYPRPMLHPLAYHAKYASLRRWPMTQGTFAIAEELGLQKHHPAHWVPAPRHPSDVGVPSDDEGAWEIGAFVGDFAAYRVDALGPYVLYVEVRPNDADHGKPGGSPIKRLSMARIRQEDARCQIVAHYAEQMNSRIVRFSEQRLGAYGSQLLSLCRKQRSTDTNLPDSAVADLLQAFQESVGLDIPANDIARKIVSDHLLMDAKRLLDVAIWQRHVRVELSEPILWNRPLLAERADVLVKFADLLAR